MYRYYKIYLSYITWSYNRLELYLSIYPLVVESNIYLSYFEMNSCELQGF